MSPSYLLGLLRRFLLLIHSHAQLETLNDHVNIITFFQSSKVRHTGSVKYKINLVWPNTTSV